MWLICLNLWAQTGPVADRFEFAQAREFDFWIGSWDVNLRTIQEDLTWKDSIQAEAHIHQVLDGKAILELWHSASVTGFSIRYFDTKSNQWQLWLNWPGKDRSKLSHLSGSFRHRRGDFTTSFTNKDGKEILARYTFCDISPNSLRWDDAYSSDRGKNWSNNWIMEFSRKSALPPPIEGLNAHTYGAGDRCPDPGFKVLQSFVGKWEGEFQSPLGDGAVEVLGSFMVGKCAVIQFVTLQLQDSTWREFRHISFNVEAKQLEVAVLDNQMDTGLVRFAGAADLRSSLVAQTDSGSTDRVTIDIKNESDRIIWTQAGRPLLNYTAELNITEKPD